MDTPTNNSSQSLLHAARNFESLIGRSDVPFIIAIYNDKTERIEFVTNMEKQHMYDFINDVAEQVENPASFETFRKNEGIQ